MGLQTDQVLYCHNFRTLALDGQDRILYLEAKDHVHNLNVLLSNEIPKSIYHGIIQKNCEDPTTCWKLFDMFKPFPISTFMIEKFNQHILSQLDKESERVAIQILDVNMELVTKSVIFVTRYLLLKVKWFFIEEFTLKMLMLEYLSK